MAKIELTPDQKAVVTHSGDALLVSAAAGSGKTAVLVDRLLRMICDADNPCNVDDFLIITYTEAAAAELRGKIAKKIGDLLAENPANKHLRKQLTRIYLAQISTVHAFCLSLLRTYGYTLDIPTDFRIGDQNECQQISQKAMEMTLQKVYEKLDAYPQCRSFFDSLGHGRNDRKIISLILNTYQKVRCHSDQEAWMQACEEQLCCEEADDISQTVWGRYLLDDMSRFLSQQVSRMEACRNKLIGSGKLEAYIPVFDDNISLLKMLQNDASWDRFSSTDVDFGRLPGVRNIEDQQLKTEVSEVRKSCKKHLENKLAAFSENSVEALTDLQKTVHPLLGLLCLVREFDKNFSKLKKQHKILDFNDLEHMAISLLVDRYTKKPNAVAKEISKKYREIMVDEYQDSNQVQDTIFHAISKDGKNLFMVGDVKQSIYSFRLADPSIFLDKYRRFSLREAEGSGPRKILLSTNFRSRKSVLDAVNHVFFAMMSEQVGDLNYGKEEALNTTRKFPDLGEPAVELHCINAAGDDEDGSGSKQEIEASFVAGRIRELITEEHYISDGDGLRRIRPEDIVILMRSVASNAPIYRAALAKQGISSFCERSGDIFSSTEVCVLLAWLRIVDNPHQDIPLVTAMASPLGGFSADEVAQIRMAGKHIDLYDALIAYAPESKKHQDFLQKLDALRKAVQWLTLTELFDFVASETNAFTVFGAMKDGTARTQNLTVLRDLCYKASQIGVRDLGSFLRYVESMIENEAKIEAGESAGNGVTIMSIHKSKGLEFPVVFLCDMSRRFNMDDFKTSVFMDKQLYIGSNVVDKELMVQYPSAAKHAMSIKKKRDMLSEELRILYVAMTRAKDRLIMTHCASNMENQMNAAALDASMPVQPCVAGSVSCPGQWILLAAALRPEGATLFGGADTGNAVGEEPWLIRYHEKIDSEEAAGTFADLETTGKVSYNTLVAEHRYAHIQSAKIPAKLTATQIKGRLLDTELPEGNVAPGTKRPTVSVGRTFLGSKELTAAQKGTAMHLFMQYCKYEKCLTEEGIAEEKQRLTDEAFLTKQQADAVNAEKILRFFRSEPGQLVTSEYEIRREFKFSLMMNSKKYFEGSNDEIMLQGVVDCFVIHDGAITVMDYKTDRVQPGQETARTEFYRPQLTAYRDALERIYGLPVRQCIVYYFETGKYCTV